MATPGERAIIDKWLEKRQAAADAEARVMAAEDARRQAIHDHEVARQELLDYGNKECAVLLTEKAPRRFMVEQGMVMVQKNLDKTFVSLLEAE